jgi:hypothetical protein
VGGRVDEGPSEAVDFETEWSHSFIDLSTSDVDLVALQLHALLQGVNVPARAGAPRQLLTRSVAAALDKS